MVGRLEVAGTVKEMEGRGLWLGSGQRITVLDQV